MKKIFTTELASIHLLTERYFCRRSFFSSLLFFLLICCVSITAFAQPTVLGTDLPGGSYATFDLNTVGGFKQYRLQATASQATSIWGWEFATGTAAATNYSTNWRPYSGGLTLSGYNAFIDPTVATASARYNSGFGGATGRLPAVTSGRYYTFNVTTNAAANNNMSVLETTYNPETITAVTQSPGASGVTVTITTSAAPSANVYVRYSIDNFVTSTLVLATFVGATGTALIPLQTAGTTVKYYVYNSPKTNAQITTDVTSFGQSAHDMATLNLNNNTGANYSYLSQPVTVNATPAINDAMYGTLKAAFDAINAGTHTGTITISISGNTTEAASAVLNASGSGAASYTAVSVKPVGNAARTVTGNLAAPLVDLFGADNVTIDGLNDGSGNTLTFTNTSTSAVAGTSTIRLYTTATNNTVQNCFIEGSTLSAADGVISVGSGSNTANVINTNTIRSTGGNLPVYSIYSSGTTNTVTVSNNNIQDYFSASVNSAGINANTGSDAWTISSNKFYQSASRTVTTAAVVVRAIQVTAGGGHTITSNTIGFANSTGTGTTTYITNTTTNQVIAIELAGNTTASSIQGNVISNIAITSASSITATAPGIFSGIYLSSGAANIGTVSGNTIGSSAVAGSISITCSVTGTALFFTGIYATSASPNAVNIQFNTVGGISLLNAGGAFQYNFNAVYVPAVTGSFNISDNSIGSNTVTNSIAIGATSTAATNFTGISNAGSGTITITGNNIQNCTASGTGASVLSGIVNTNCSGVLSITNNSIISCTNAGTGSFIAINNSAVPSTLNITGSVIRSNSITSGTGAFTAITNSGAATSAININNNQLGNASGGLITFTIANSSNLLGINNTAGGAGAALTIQANDLRGITNSVQGTGNHTYISNSAATLSQNISTNTFTNLTANITTGGGSVTFISNSVSLSASGIKTINDNTIVGTFTKTGGGGNIYFYFDAGSSATGAFITNDGNNFSNITANGAIPVQGWFNTDGVNPTKNITNNTFNNINNIFATGSAIFPIQITNGTGNISTNTITNCSAPNTVTGLTVTNGSFSIFSNTINTLSSSTSSAGVTGINISGGTTHNIYSHTIYNLSSSATSTTVAGIAVSAGTTVNIYKNKIYDLSESAVLASGGVYGISITGGTTVSVYNNLIGTFTTPSANFNDVIRGISATGGTTLKIYYNTVYLNASSSGASFGSSALYASNTPSLDLRNNILYNISTPGSGGLTVAYRRNGTALTNYAATSNNNIFYAGTPGATRLIFYDGTNSDQSFVANYQPRVSPRDNVSGSATLTFISTIGSSPNFLHMNTTSIAESGGATIGGFTDDYDGEVRSATPDIGADEFVSVVCPATPTITGISTAAPYYAGDVITITGTNLTGITYATIGGITTTISSPTATTADLLIPVTLTDSSALIQVAFSSSCTYSNTFSFVFSGYITIGGQGAVNWGTNTIWKNNALPVDNAPAVINTGDNVSLNISADPCKLTILSGSSLTHQTNGLKLGNSIGNYLAATTVNGILTIDNAGLPVLTTIPSFKSTRLVVTGTGTFTNNSATAAAVNITNFWVDAGGTYNHNAVGSTTPGVVADFPGGSGSGTRTFGNTSNVVITKWANGANNPINLPASGSPGWGNLTINVASLAGSWNQQGNLSNIQGNWNIMATGGFEFRLISNSGAGTITNVGGSLNVSGGILKESGGSSSYTVNVTGNMTVSTGGTYTPTNSSGSTGTTNVTGVFTVSGGTVTSPGSGHIHVYTMASVIVSGAGIFGMAASSTSAFTLMTGSINISGTASMASTNTGPVTINCTGDFTCTSNFVGAAFAFQGSGSTAGKPHIFNLGGNFSVTGTGKFLGGGQGAGSELAFNFIGGAASVTYTAAPSLMPHNSPINIKNNFFVTSGKTVTLNNSIIPASSSSSNSWTFTVNTGGILDCGTTAEIGGANAQTVFTLQTGATLRTGHVGGVFSTTALAASITTTAANASLSSGATYVFNGTSSQVSSAFTTTPTASTVANIVINNSAGVTLSASYDVTAALQMQTGNLTLSTFNLTTASITGSPYSNTKMVNTNSTGALGQPVPTAGLPATILFPVGNGTSYTPANYTFTANSTARYLNVRAVTPRNSNDVSATDYINNRWWNTDLSVTTGTYTYTSSYTFLAPDVVGTAANIRLNRWTGSAWVQDAGSSITGLNLNSGSLNETTGTLAATAQWVGRVYTAPAIYHWVNAAGGSWLTTSNWFPTGVPGSGDGVIFDAAGSPTYTTTNMPTGINLTYFKVDLNNKATLVASATGTINMVFPGFAAPQLSVTSGSSMIINSANAVNLNLPVNATGIIAGTLGLQGALHRVTVATAGALVFPSGGYFYAGVIPATGFSGNPFGATGTNGAVIFQNGSICETFEGANPFGNPGVNIVTFQTGSLFRYSDPNPVTLPSTGGRTYANFEYNASKTANCQGTPSAFVCDDLTATVGTINIALEGTPGHSVKGNITVAAVATLTFSPDITTPTSGTVNMSKAGTQNISGAGTFNVNNLVTLDINAGTTASLQKNMGVNSTGNIAVNGTLILTGENYINTPTTAGGTVTLNNGGTLSIQSVDGISNAGVGNIRSTNFTYNAGGNFTYSGTANQVTGNRLPVTLSGTPLSQLTIANTGSAPNNIVTLTTNGTTTARINLNSGQFNAGIGGTLIINGGTNLVVGGGGNQYLAGASTDNIIRFSTNGAVQGTPELYNVTIGTSGTGVDFTNNARINGIFLINSGGFVNPNAPKYNTGSYLIYNTTGTYDRSIEWGNNSGLGVAGYPHHVTVQNGTTLNFLNTTTFDIGCGGDLTLGTTTAGTLRLTDYLQPYDLFIKGNINIGGTVPSGTLTMSNSIGCDIFLTGNWTRNTNGIVNFGFGNGRSVYLEGSTDATITASGGQYFPYIRMQKTLKTTKVTLADNVSIGFEVTFTKGTLDLGTNNKFFSILSNANYDGRVAPSDSSNMAFVYGASDNTGQFIVQRYFPAQRKWRLLNAPLKPAAGTHSISQAWQEQGNGASGRDYNSASWAASVAADSITAAYGTQITGGTTANGFDLSPNNNSSIKYFAGAGTWSTPATTNSTNVNSQEGWLLFVRGDRKNYGEITNQYKAPTITTLRPRGQIFIGQKTLTSTGMTTVGNPYASAVDYFTMSRAGAGWPAQPTYNVWDPSLGGVYGVGAFVTYTWNGSNAFIRSSPYGPGSYDDRYIPSGAAIMVDFGSGGTLSMNEANKNTDSNTTAFRPVGHHQMMTVLQAKDGDNSMYVADASLSLFDNSFNNDVDVNDARKLSNIKENISLKRNDRYLSIERKKLKGEADTIFYSMSRLQRKDYQLQFVMDNLELPQSITAFLEDTYLKKKTAVSLHDTGYVSFNVTADSGSAAAERFRLVFRRSVRYTSINAVVLNSDVVVNWTVNDELNIDHYEIERSGNGTNFSTIATMLSNGESEVPVNYNALDAEPAPGEYYYRIKSVSKNGVVTYSDAVKVKVVKGSPALYVFPNPVTNGTIQLQLNKAAAGTYSTRLYGSNGQLVTSEIIYHEGGGTATKTIKPAAVLNSGTYQLEITSPDNKVTVIKIIVNKN